jgi:hypothetical protein
MGGRHEDFVSTGRSGKEVDDPTLPDGQSVINSRG